MLALLEAVRRAGGIVYVPTVCLVESLTGKPSDAVLNQRLKGTIIVPLNEHTARLAARLRAELGGDDAVDPVVVATAQVMRATVVSADTDDIGPLASRLTPAVPVVDPREGS